MIIPLLRLIRPYYSVPFAAGLAVITAYLTAGVLEPVASRLIYAIGALFCIIAGGYALNDFCDVEADRINCPDRPLPSGDIAPQIALLFSSVLFIVGLSLAIFAGVKYLIGLSLVTAGLVIYDIFSKQLGVGKDILVATLMTSLYPLAFCLAEPTAGPRLNTLYIHPAWLFLTAFGYEMLKDAGHTEGDRLKSVVGIAAYSQKSWFLPLARTLLIVAAVITITPWLLGYCKSLYLVGAIISVILTLIAAGCSRRSAIVLIGVEVALITTISLADLLIMK